MAEISPNAFVDIDFINTMAGEILVTESSSGNSDDEIRMINIINAVTSLMEKICNRPLKARDFTYDDDSDDYSPDYSIFDGPEGNIFWFPTYPVNSVTTLIISDTTVIAATSYDDSTGYFLYSKKGQLVYSYGFDYGYNQNVKIAYNAGYADTHEEYTQLQYIAYLMVKNYWDSDPNVSSDIIGETLGNYKYIKSANAATNAKLLNLPVFVLDSLLHFRREAIA